MGSSLRLRIMGHLPERKQGAEAQNYERKEDGTDDFTELPSDLFHPSLTPFVESDHSRHHGLHKMAEECTNQGVGEWSRHPLFNGEIVPFGVSLLGYATTSSSIGGDERTESD
jgi:hypothetical protein